MTSLLYGLLGTPGIGVEALDAISEPWRSKIAAMAPARPAANCVGGAQLELLREAWQITHPDAVLPDYLTPGDRKEGRLEGLSSSERLRLASEVLMAFGKVANYIEMYEYRPGRSRGVTRAGEELVRKPEVAARFNARTAPNPDTGAFVRGQAQSPLVNPGLPPNARDIQRALPSDLVISRMYNVLQAWFEKSMGQVEQGLRAAG
jgi:hypothetical protein